MKNKNSDLGPPEKFTLTQEELEIAYCLVEYYAPGEIGEVLGKEINAVRNAKRRIMKRLNASSVEHLKRLLIKSKILKDEECIKFWLQHGCTIYFANGVVVKPESLN